MHLVQKAGYGNVSRKKLRKRAEIAEKVCKNSQPEKEYQGQERRKIT